MKQVVTFGVNDACCRQTTIIDGVMVEESIACRLPSEPAERSYCYECGGAIYVSLEDHLVTEGNPLGLVVRCELCGWVPE